VNNCAMAVDVPTVIRSALTSRLSAARTAAIPSCRGAGYSEEGLQDRGLPDQTVRQSTEHGSVAARSAVTTTARALALLRFVDLECAAFEIDAVQRLHRT